MNAWHELTDVARAHCGLVTVADARRLGIPESTVHRHADINGWERLHHGVWALPGSLPSPERALAAALLCVGAPAAVGRRSAAWLWQLRGNPPPTAEILLPHGRALSSRAGIRIVRTRSFSTDDLTVHAGLPVTSVARTLADLARLMDADALAGAMIKARQRGLVDIGELAAMGATIGKAPGAGRFRRTLVRVSSSKVDSLLELDIRERLLGYGIPPPAPHPLWLPVPAGRRQLDIAWPREMVGLEVDGFAYHSSHEDLTRDHVKQNQAAALGWLLLRVGWDRWRRDRAGFIEELRAVLTSRRPNAGYRTPTIGRLATRIR